MRFYKETANLSIPAIGSSAVGRLTAPLMKEGVQATYTLLSVLSRSGLHSRILL
jgi:hypothetical protein